MATNTDVSGLADLLHLHRLDHDELAHLSLVQELDTSGDLGEKRVIFAATDVQPGLHARTALSDDDGTAGHDLPAECLKAEPLRVRVAAIS